MAKKKTGQAAKKTAAKRVLVRYDGPSSRLMSADGKVVLQYGVETELTKGQYEKINRHPNVVLVGHKKTDTNEGDS